MPVSYKPEFLNLKFILMKSIYTHPKKVKEISIYIHNNFKNCYITTIDGHCYYNVKGIVWKVWQSGTGSYPTTEGTKFTNFKF